VKDDSPNHPSEDNTEPGQEKWISKTEAINLYGVTDRNLKYWRSNNKIEYKLVKNLTFYLEHEVRAMAEKQTRPKKRFRKEFIAKKLGSIDYVLGVVIFAVGWAWATGINLEGPWWNVVIRNMFLSLVFFVAIIYGIVRFIQFIRRRYFRKK
jgi:hypothetical protein